MTPETLFCVEVETKDKLKDWGYDQMWKSFFKTKEKRLVITDNVSGVNKLVRAYSRSETVYGVKVVSILQLASELVLAYKAIYAADKNYKIIDTNIQSMRMTTVLQKCNISMLTHETKTVSSANEILSILNQIRKSSPSDYFCNATSENKRIFELKQILEAYEAALQEKDELDSVMVLQEAITLLQLAKEKPEAIVYLGILSADLSETVVGGLFTEEMSDLEEQFMKSLISILGEKYTEIRIENRDDYEYAFFKAYGIANEVKHIKDTIADQKLPYGEVAILYPNEAYEHFLMAEFDASEIRYCFPRGFRAQASDYISFLIDLVGFASSDFEYKRFYKILQNPVIRIKNSKKAFRRFSEVGIGYGRDRYLSFFQNYAPLFENDKTEEEELEGDELEEVKPEEDKLETDKYEEDKYKNCGPFFQFLKDVINCFHPSHTCEEIFRDLIKLSTKYTDNKDLYRACVKEDLKDFANALSLWEANDFAEKLYQIELYLKKLKCRTSESAGAVSILPYGNTEIIDRKYIFAVGLSNENISAPNVESPVLCDEELRHCVDGKVQLAMEKNKRRKDAFLRTMNLSMQEKVYFSYSYYDSVSIIANSPSLLFQQVLEKKGIKETEIPSFGYEVGKDSLELTSPDMSRFSAEEEEETNTYKNFSASSLQTLVHCPMCYYYEKIRRIPQISIQERTPDSWLPANIKGNVFHHVMEKYVNEVIIQQGNTQKDDTTLMNIFENEIAECIKSVPISSQATFEMEKEESLEALKRYITELHDELNNSGNKKIIGCEVPFEGTSYVGVLEKDGTIIPSYELLLRGSVDRLDGMLEEDGSLKLQIYDYKTGSYSKKKEEIEKNSQIQHHIYAIAMKEWAGNHKQELEGLFGKSIERIYFDDARYLFPFEEEKRELTAKCIIDEKSGAPVLPKEMHDILLCTVANYQAGEVEEAIELSAQLSQSALSVDEKHCKYCSYSDVCRVCL